MRFVSARRALPVSLASAAVLALGMMPGIANAAPKGEVGEQCSGPRIEGAGSTFQAPLQFIWTGVNSEKGNEKLKTGYDHSKSKDACSGTQGTKAKPEVYYNQEEQFRGSGACLRAFGEGTTEFGEEKTVDGQKLKFPDLNKFPECSTDEAPKQSVKEGYEKFVDKVAGFEGGKGEAIESLPVAQGAEAIIVHLPKGCLASSEIKTPTGKKEKLGRLALDREVIEEIYRGKIKTWAQAMEKQGTDGDDHLECPEGGLEKRIRPVVRADKSGTTHIFKAFLLQVYSGTFPAEEFKEVNKGENPCKGEGELQKGAIVSWAQVSEGCENQRWPEEAEVLRPVETGNPGVINEVHKTESSIGYADLAVAQERGFFSNKGEGGENEKGEQNEQFWAVVQDSAKTGKTETFSDPQTKGDIEKAEESNCKDTKYVAAKGEKFPPESTRDDWSKVKGEDVSKTYAICGVTYVLAPRQMWYFLEPYKITEAESLKIATSVHDFLDFVTAKTGGQDELKKSDYEALPKAVQEEDAVGAEEIGNKEA
ncbi:MAG TPA: substrate-binding domain-containing protein [Solirubrobacteraceae bacterium]|nr:substrate-binding domain-containing protein [Solirubrobacteraceae bacterium]